jgi:hypothetical protein
MTSYLKVSEFLDMRFPGRWVGRDGLIPWPQRPPDITALDFSIPSACLYHLDAIPFICNSFQTKSKSCRRQRKQTKALSPNSPYALFRSVPLCILCKILRLLNNSSVYTLLLVSDKMKCYTNGDAASR